MTQIQVRSGHISPRHSELSGSRPVPPARRAGRLIELDVTNHACCGHGVTRMKNNLEFARPTAAALGLLALLGAIPAYAADAVMEEPPAPAAPMEEPPLNTWTGPYAGVTVGYGFSGNTDDGRLGNEHRHRRLRRPASSPATTTRSATSSPARKPTSATAGQTASNAGYELQLGPRRLAARPSRLCRDRRHPALRHGRRRGQGASRSPAAASSDNNTMLGWTAGAGADIMVTENVFGRVEYRYTDFGSDTFNGGGPRGRATREQPHHLRPRHEVLI